MLQYWILLSLFLVFIFISFSCLVSVTVYVMLYVESQQNKDISSIWRAHCEPQTRHRLTLVRSCDPSWSIEFDSHLDHQYWQQILKKHNIRLLMWPAVGWKRCLEGSLTWRDEDAVGESLVWRWQWDRPAFQHGSLFGYELTLCLIWDFPPCAWGGSPYTETHTHT